MDVVEVVPTFEQYAFTFGGVAPLRRIAPGTALRLWSDDAFCGALRSVNDLSAEKVDLRFVNPQTGPFYVEGAEPGDTLALHFVAMEPARDWGASAAIPFFGGLTSTDRVATLQDPLPDTTWIYELDRARNTVTFAAAAQRPAGRPAGRADARHRRCRAGRRRGAQLAGARPVRRQHGHPADAGRRHCFLGVNVEGALFSVGDGHYRQGEGEACGTAVEGAMTTTLIVELIKGGAPAWPRLEDDTHWMAVGSSRPLEDAWRIGQVELVRWLGELYGLHPMDAYQLLLADQRRCRSPTSSTPTTAPSSRRASPCCRRRRLRRPARRAARARRVPPL